LNFPNPTNKQHCNGSIVDQEKLVETFKKLGSTVNLLKKKKKKEIERKIIELRKWIGPLMIILLLASRPTGTPINFRFPIPSQ
jgi:hypothetical protein